MMEMTAENQQELTDIVQEEKVSLSHRAVGVGALIATIGLGYLALRCMLEDDFAALGFYAMYFYTSIVAAYNLMR